MKQEPIAHTKWRLEAAYRAAACYRDALMIDPTQNARDHRIAMAHGDRWTKYAHEEVVVPVYGGPSGAVAIFSAIALCAGFIGAILGAWLF